MSASAGIQAPTLYRLFGDKQGLLDEVAIHGFTTALRHTGRRRKRERMRVQERMRVRSDPSAKSQG